LSSSPGFSVCPQLPAAAEAINKSHDPVFIINAIGNPGQIISLCRLLRDDVKLHLVHGDTLDSIPDEYQQVLLFTPWQGPFHLSPELDCSLSAWDFGVITRRDPSQ
jgi:hypothetical protein